LHTPISVTFNEISQVYNAKDHPKVKSGEITEQQALEEWMNVLEGSAQWFRRKIAPSFCAASLSLRIAEQTFYL